MKNLFLLILIPFLMFGRQPEAPGEFRIDLINYGSSWNVTFTLTAMSARWDENFDLTEDYEIISETISNTPLPENSAYFEHVLDDGPNTFAICLYKISAIEGGVEQAYFYGDWRTSDWRESLDWNVKYDVGNNRFRNTANTVTIDFSIQTLWEHTGNLLETSGFRRLLGKCPFGYK